MITDNYWRHEEVTLIELLRVLVKRKTMFLILFFVPVLIAAALIGAMPTVHKSRAVISLPRGATPFQKMFMSGPEFADQLKEEYEIGNTFRSARPLPRLEQALVTGNNIVAIAAIAGSSEEATSYLGTELQNIFSRLEASHKAAQNVQTKIVETKTARLAAIEAAITRLSVSKTEVAKSNTQLASTAAIELASLQTSAGSIEAELAEDRQVLAVLEAHPPTILHGARPMVNGKPVQPRPLTYLTMGALLGLILGLAGIFIAEFVWITAPKRPIPNDEVSERKITRVAANRNA